MKVKDAKKITESLTRTSKMPGLILQHFQRGHVKLGPSFVRSPASPCFGCYALKGNYTRYPAIKAAQYRRLDAIDNPLMGHRYGNTN